MVHVKSFLPDPPTLPPTNISTFLLDSRDVPDHLLYIDGLSGQRRTRNEFKERVGLARTILGSKVENGGVGLDSQCMVAIFSENCMEYATLVLALCSLAVPFALCSAYATQYELAHFLRISKATHIFAHSDLLETALGSAKEVGLPTSGIHILEGARKHGFYSLENYISKAKSANMSMIATKPVTRNQLAFLLFSSGTTGLPKAVAISHNNVIDCTLQSLVWLQSILASPSPPVAPPNGQLNTALGYLPMYHTFGLHSYCLRPFVVPSTVVLIPRWNTNLALYLIPKYRVTTLPSVPPIIQQLSNSPDLTKTDMSSVISIASGAAYLPPVLAQKVSQQLGGAVKVVHGYGLSEVTISAINMTVEGQLGRWKYNPDATGALIPGMEARTVREDGSEAEYGETGELWLKGPNVALGYYGNPKATKETFVDGWVRTGDNFKIDREGYFYFQDRAKDIMKISGMQVSPAEIESTLLNHPGGLIEDVAVAGVQISLDQTGADNDGLSRLGPRAWVVLTEKGRSLGEKRVAQELNDWLKSRLSRYKQLTGGIGFVSEIPKIATGKVLRRQLVENYAKETQGTIRAKL